jgi:hypothetical protein
MLSHRLQVLLDEERWDRLRRESARRHVPIGELVREAIDRWVPRGAGEVRAAADRLLAADPIRLPEDPADLKAERRAAHATRAAGGG